MTTAPHAVQAGAGTPESDKARGANAGLVGEQRQETSPDSAAVDADCKEFSRLRAQLALHGHHLHCTGSGFMVTCGGWSTELVDLPAVRAFVKRIGGVA